MNNEDATDASKKKKVLSCIAAATSQESNGNKLEAFNLYLSSIQEVCELLGTRRLPPVDHWQLVTLAQQCLDRISHLYGAVAVYQEQEPVEEQSTAAGEQSQLYAEPESALEWRLRRLRGGGGGGGGGSGGGGVPPPGSAAPTDSPPPGGGARRSSEAWSTYRAASFCEPRGPPPLGLLLDARDDDDDDDSDECVSIEDNRLVPATLSASMAPPGDEEAAPRGDGGADAVEADAAPGDGKDSSFEPHNLDLQQDRWPSAEEEEQDNFSGEVLHPRFPIPKPVETLDDCGEPSPLDAARRENERLVATYAMRMQHSPAHVQHNLRLELQRRLAENRQIATMKHRAWLQRRHEARQHHLEVAKRVFAAESGAAGAGAGGGPGSSAELVQKQTTFADVLQFEASHGWTVQVRRSLDANPQSERAVENALLHMLLEKSHPLSKLRQRLQYSIYCKISPLVEQHAHLLEAARVPAWSPVQAAGPEPRPHVTHDAAAGGGHVTPAAGAVGGHVMAALPRLRRRSNSESCVVDGGGGGAAGADAAVTDEPAAPTVGVLETAEPQPTPDQQRAAADGGGHVAVTAMGGAPAAGGVGDAAAAPHQLDTRRVTLAAAPQRAHATTSHDELILHTEAFQRHLRNVISDTQDSVRLLESLTAAVHGALSGPAARAVLQRLLFTPLWPHLLVLFRLANWRQEALLAAALRRRRRCAAAPELPPPAAARRQLRALLQAAAPADKCRQLVQLVRQLCETGDRQEPAGADLLLPRLTQLVVREGRPQLVSELHFISEFMSEGSFQGEQGYCLTSLQTVLLYLVQQEQG